MDFEGFNILASEDVLASHFAQSQDDLTSEIFSFATDKQGQKEELRADIPSSFPHSPQYNDSASENGNHDEGNNDEECTSQNFLQPLNASGHSRAWKIVHISPRLYLTSNCLNGSMTVEQIQEYITLTIKTRSDNETHLNVPTRLYSSLKYEIRQCVSCGLCDSPTIMTRIDICDPNNPEEEILKTNGQKLLKGISDMTALSKNPATDCFESKLKIQFTDVSYHHEKKHFSFKISFFDPSISLSEPVFVLVSAPFQVFARRPTKEKKPSSTKAIKRKKKEDLEEENDPENNVDSLQKEVDERKIFKKQKLSHLSKLNGALTKSQQMVPIVLKSTPALTDFIQCLNLLVAFKNSLPEEDRQAAKQLVQAKLFENEITEDSYLDI